MPAFVNFTCQRCGAELASLAQVDAHKCLIPKPPAESWSERAARTAPHARSKRDRINRLRERASRAKAFGDVGGLADAISGILDLLGDEL